MRRKSAFRIVGCLAPFIGFAGSVVGMSRIFAAIESPQTLNPYSLTRAVGVALVTTLLLMGVVVLTLAAWTQFRRHSD